MHKFGVILYLAVIWPNTTATDNEITTGCLVCLPNYINCTEDAKNIKQELINISNNLPEGQKHFKMFLLNAPIKELPRNMFHDIEFDQIIIKNATNLEKVHSNSFDSTKLVTKVYQNWQNFVSKLRNNPPRYDLYAALSSLVNVNMIYISLETYGKHEIPDRAFRPINGIQQNLNNIEFYGYYTISRIGNYAFYNIPNLSSIVFKYMTIEYISTNAFDFVGSNSSVVIIDMRGTSLNESCFADATFGNSKRPLKVLLGQNNIRYIEERVFDAFFKSNPNNSIYFDDNPLNCDDIIPFNWLLREKKLKDRLLDAVCANKTKFWDLNYVQSYPDIISNITESLEEIVEMTGRDDLVTTGEKLKEIIDSLKNLQNLVDSQISLIDFEKALNLTTNFLQAFSNLIDRSNAWTNSTDIDKTEMASQILLQIQYTSFTLSCNQNNSNDWNEIINTNMIFNSYHTNFSQELTFKANSSSILIPKEINWSELNECNNSAYGALINRLDRYLLPGISDQQQTNTRILAFGLANSSQTNPINDGNYVIISLEHYNQLQFGDKVICVFWDFQSMKWSSDGCQIVLDESNRDFSICKCNHLTNFAAIMDVSGREKNDSFKSILTDICCGLSIICLILTIGLLLTSRKSRRNTITDKLLKTRNMITINLCICLLIADILIIFGMDRIDIKWLCQTLSGLLLYSLLASFSWMLLEGYHLYRMTFYVFASTSQQTLHFAFGYGVPIFILFTALFIIWLRENIFFDALIGEYFCWISSHKYPGHVWVLVGPALTAILINTVLMYFLLKKITESNRSKDKVVKHKLTIKQIFGVTSLLFNLGITWSLFVLYIQQFGPYFSYFSYVFIILNGSQGVFIFIYHLVIYINKRSRIFKASFKTTQTR